MTRGLRIKSRLRFFAHDHPWLVFALRSFTIFSAAFGGSYGFLVGSKPEISGYNPHTFAIGASFLFALACMALATLSFRLRLLRNKLHEALVRNEALADHNWELREAEQRARSLFESQSDLIVLRDSKHRITFVNEAFCMLAQKSRVELTGSIFNFSILEQGPVSVALDGTRVHDQKIATPLGTRWIGWREGLIWLHADRPAEMQSVGRDVTDRTETEIALSDARDHANAANRAKSKFLAMASHEICTPLNGIIGMSDLLFDTPLTAEQTTYVRAVKTSGEALLVLIDELLDFSKIEAGKIDLEHRPFVLAAMIEDIAELLAPRAQARHLEIAAYVDERLPVEVVGDAARLRQVLLNLAGNAIKFTSRGGVALIVEPGSVPDNIRFIVRDTGVGIAPEAQARIFREFEQADERTVRNYGGTGLGLSISERIVKRMGGRITLKSAPGRGSTFQVTVPLAAAEGPAGGSHLAVSPDLQGKSVMLVARQAIEASLIARRLQRWGAQTDTLSDTAMAEALLFERSWHAIIVDHDLGTDDIARLGHAAQARVPYRIVMITPSARRTLQPAATYGFTGYLVKPLRAASLAARLTMTVATDAPKLAADGIPDARTAAPTPVPATGLSILVAEDNDINALLMRSLLTRLGHRPVITTDGEQAVEQWLTAQNAGSPYDLVLMDVQMPKLDGIETTRRIRAHELSSADAADAHHRADGEYPVGRSRRLFRGGHGWISRQAARSQQARRHSGQHPKPAACDHLSRVFGASELQLVASMRHDAFSYANRIHDRN